jgi:hypothetical protein
MRPTTPATRRAFLRKAGVALSGPLAVALAAPAAPGPATNESLRNRLGALEDTLAIRAVHQSYAKHLNERAFDAVVELFSEDSAVRLYGELFVGKAQGVRRLFVEHFDQRIIEGETPVHRRLLPRDPHEDLIEVAADRASATGRFHCLVQAEAALPAHLPLIEMARLQGQGTRQWWENGVYESTYVRAGSAWKIQHLEYRALGRAEAV